MILGLPNTKLSLDHGSKGPNKSADLALKASQQAVIRSSHCQGQGLVVHLSLQTFNAKPII